MKKVIFSILLSCSVSCFEPGSFKLDEIQNLASFQHIVGNRHACSLLEQNGFVILPSDRYKSIYDLYIDAKKRDKSIFVTSDLILHTTHILFDYMLRILELSKLEQEVEELTKIMLEKSKLQFESFHKGRIKEAVRRNVAFFSVAAKILEIETPIPKEITTDVEEELKLIEEHKRLSPSPIFKYVEDYSQYLPRGHYTRNELFKKYFKVMMWYGRVSFYLRPSPEMYRERIDPIEEGKTLTQQALLMVNILNKVKARWARVYEPTIFFVGKTDDLNYYDYVKLAEEIYGKEYTVENLSDENKLGKFIERALKLRKPKIISTYITDAEKKIEESTFSFRFFGQRFIPDSYILQNMVYPKVKNFTGSGEPFTMYPTPMGPQRCLPRGLDVMAVLGSRVAEAIIREEGDGDYENYDEVLNKLRREFAELPDSVWNQNLYWLWLSCLKLLIKEEGQLIKNKAWFVKQLNTALGSWAELRHDTILYAKQSYTRAILSRPPTPKLTRGYVEPFPSVYKQIKKLITTLRETLDSEGLLLDECKNKLLRFEDILGSLGTISEKELKGQTLTEDEYKMIWNIGEILKSITKFSRGLMEKITTGTDEEMACVADVHTDVNSKQVLEEAVGYPYYIYVICKIDGKGFLTVGGIFSYYEFKQSMSERLTDEKWQEILKESPPQNPEWYKYF